MHDPIELSKRVGVILASIDPLLKVDHVEAQKLGLTGPQIVEVDSSNNSFSSKVGTMIYFSDNRKIIIQKNYGTNQIDVLSSGWDNNLDTITKVRQGLGLNAAMLNGGIDLNPANMDLQTHNNSDEIKFHLDPAMLLQLKNAPGFYPKVISIQPLVDLQQFLGINESKIL